MPPPDALTAFEWTHMHERMDRSVAEAARAYALGLSLRRIPFNRAQLLQEVTELRLGREPNYNLPGFPLLYALRYMPRRVISILGALSFRPENLYPTSVLDLGSGTGAAALALDLLAVPQRASLVGIDQSPEMIAFARGLRLKGRVSVTYQQGSISNLVFPSTRSH